MRKLSRTLEMIVAGTERIMHYRGYGILPKIAKVPEAEPFGGTWVILHCCFGKATSGGYEVRYLLSDNDHFSTCRAAGRAARLRAIRTIELDEVGAMHLSAVSVSDLEPRYR